MAQGDPRLWIAQLGPQSVDRAWKRVPGVGLASEIEGVLSKPQGPRGEGWEGHSGASGSAPLPLA